MSGFVSSGALDAKHAQLERDRALVLEQAKQEFLASQARDEAVKRRKEQTGEDTWIVPGLDERLSKRHKSGKEKKKNKKEKKSKHKKKSKKASKSKKDHKDKSEPTDDGDLSSSDSGSNDDEWVQKSTDDDRRNQSSWMFTGDAGDPFSALMSGGISSSRDTKQPAKEEKEKEYRDEKEQLGQHKNELNPFWKNGGKGLPPEAPRSEAATESAMNRGWRAKMMQRRSGASDHGGVTGESTPISKVTAFGEDVGNSKRRSMSNSFLGSPSVGTPTSVVKSVASSFLGTPSTSSKEGATVPTSATTTVKAESQPPRKRMDPNKLAAAIIRAELEGDEEEVERLKKQQAEAQQTAKQPPRKRMDPNKLAAAIIRAELEGDDEEVERLKRQQAEAEQDRQSDSTSGNEMTNRSSQPTAQLLLRQTRDGTVMPARGVAVERDRQAYTGKIRRSREKLDTHADKDGRGDRLRYFADDDKNSDLSKMVERERLGLDDDPNQVYSKFSSKFMAKTDDDDYTMDDMFVDRIGKKQAQGKQENRDRDRAVAEHIRSQKQLDSCRYCFDNVKVDKHLIISIGQKVYMSLPARGSLADGHVLLIPVRHVTSCTEMDEDVYDEIQVFQENLVKMWKAQGKDAVFMETVYNTKHKQHTVVHCVPLNEEDGELAPMFFKKAIQDCHTFDSQNKTLVDTRKKGLRKCVPKGFPYFSVGFGMDGGFAHVIENETVFPKYFGFEIVGNIVDVPPRTWLNPQKERFETQKRKVLDFSKKWADYDWTTMLDDVEAN